VDIRVAACFNGAVKEVGVLLVIVGAGVALLGLLLLLTARAPWLGYLPGDVHLRGKNWSFSFPLATCILVSILLTVLLNAIIRLFRR
jgi:hypothetical protein